MARVEVRFYSKFGTEVVTVEFECPATHDPERAAGVILRELGEDEKRRLWWEVGAQVYNPD